MIWSIKSTHGVTQGGEGRCSQRGGIGNGLLLGRGGVGISVSNERGNVPPSATRAVSLFLVDEGALLNSDIVHESNR